MSLWAGGATPPPLFLNHCIILVIAMTSGKTGMAQSFQIRIESRQHQWSNLGAWTVLDHNHRSLLIVIFRILPCTILNFILISLRYILSLNLPSFPFSFSTISRLPSFYFLIYSLLVHILLVFSKSLIFAILPVFAIPVSYSLPFFLSESYFLSISTLISSPSTCTYFFVWFFPAVLTSDHRHLLV